MPHVDPDRQFAEQVVRQLRAAGHEALWAGGCVRDWLLGRTPKDYDVATSARPDQVRQVFGRRRTIPVGAAFGVITVLGPKPAQPIDVATFRQDADYTDGRHPDEVHFSDAEHDAARRDFTINGLFYDPVAGRVVDYVGGEADLAAGLVRAIGDPHQRLAEDKLRLLRAVRFAATYEFELEEETLRAVQQHADEIHLVAQERICAELRRMLEHAQRVTAMKLLRTARLLEEVLPEAMPRDEAGEARWRRSLAILARLQPPTLPLALAALLWEAQGNAKQTAGQVCRRLRMSNDETGLCIWVLRHAGDLRRAQQLPWSRLQPLLVDERCDSLLRFAAAVAVVLDAATAQIDLCRAKITLPPEQLDPAPLLPGADLIELKLPRGPLYRRILEAARTAQLDGQISSRAEALELARRIGSS